MQITPHERVKARDKRVCHAFVTRLDASCNVLCEQVNSYRLRPIDGRIYKNEALVSRASFISSLHHNILYFLPFFLLQQNSCLKVVSNANFQRQKRRPTHHCLILISKDHMGLPVPTLRPRGRERATKKRINKLGASIDPDTDGILWQSPAAQRRIKELQALLKTPTKPRKRRQRTSHIHILPLDSEDPPTPWVPPEATTSRTPIIYRVCFLL